MVKEAAWANLMVTSGGAETMHGQLLDLLVANLWLYTQHMEKKIKC